MPIKQFTYGELASSEIDRQNIAYAKTLRMLDLVDRNDPVTSIVAEKIIKVGTSGLTDPNRIADIVAHHFLKS
ncbi:hypothetical protein [Bradyrhizobium sp.]|uniref:hypothetical protein n=1 Tax=Bradyrhizobium sp. TaxID=376 RepID=UPI002D38432D|nr:hypothetical protein [Bradyrhizobium sp.]HZR72624.1 hypothetical protein [Bradyrhizobium sp.]